VGSFSTEIICWPGMKVFNVPQPSQLCCVCFHLPWTLIKWALPCYDTKLSQHSGASGLGPCWLESGCPAARDSIASANSSANERRAPNCSFMAASITLISPVPTSGGLQLETLAGSQVGVRRRVSFRESSEIQLFQLSCCSSSSSVMKSCSSVWGSCAFPAQSLVLSVPVVVESPPSRGKQLFPSRSTWA